MKIESRKCINIRKIEEYLGTDVAAKFPQIHAAAGRDTTSFLHGVGKIKVLKKCLNWKEKLSLPNTIGVSCKVSDTTVKGVKKFIQTVCYSEKEEESLTETRVPVYRQMKTKTSQSLPPDENSMLQKIKPINCKIYYWSRVDEAIISDVWFVDNENEEVRPLRFTGIWFNFMSAYP